MNTKENYDVYKRQIVKDAGGALLATLVGIPLVVSSLVYFGVLATSFISLALAGMLWSYKKFRTPRI